jgi:hypothetical protein
MQREASQEPVLRGAAAAATLRCSPRWTGWTTHPTGVQREHPPARRGRCAAVLYPLRATRDRGSSACQSASCHQMEYLVTAPQWSPRSGGRGCRVARLDHPFDHPDDPTGSVSIRPDRRPSNVSRARSVWSRPDRRRAPGYGSGGLAYPTSLTPAFLQRKPSGHSVSLLHSAP